MQINTARMKLGFINLVSTFDVAKDRMLWIYDQKGCLVRSFLVHYHNGSPGVDDRDFETWLKWWNECNAIRD